MTSYVTNTSIVTSSDVGSGFEPFTIAGRNVVYRNVTSQWMGNATPLVTSQQFSCDVWIDPARAILQILVLLMIFLNFSASLVVFSVPTNIRGKHVSFLFGCVRVLNILDILQCVVIFVSPLLIPPSCDANPLLCNTSGYLFATSTLFSPLVAIIMAVDRAVAVYFHVWYKQHPYLKTKYFVLGSSLAIYGLYFSLPIYTNFGKYVAVPWLSLCSFEWGRQYRTFNLILEVANLLLFIVLLIANATIVIRVRKRQKQMKKMKSLHEKNKRGSVRRSIMRKLHRSADDIINMSGDESPSGAPDVATPSTFRKRMSKSRPPPLRIPQADFLSEQGKSRLTPSVTPPLTPLTRAKTSSASYRRPKSQGNHLLTPPSLVPGDPRPPSPLVATTPDWTNNQQRTRTMTVTSRPRSLMRSTSADNILQASGAFLAPLPSSKPQTPTLLRQVLDYTPGKMAEGDNPRHSTTTRSSDESDASRRRFLHSSTSSFFPFPFTPRGSTKRPSESRKKNRMVRKSASRITKMTTGICMVFVVLYFPFLIRKLIQLFPAEYASVHVPSGVEIFTLFGPFLSPLFNPVVYVFLNPHYKDNCAKKLRLLRSFLPCSSSSRRLFSTSTTQFSFRGSTRRRPRPKHSLDSAHKSDQPLSSNHDDVFETAELRGKSPNSEACL